jgi:DeoR family transcriptional regulator, fructose operon transcriptional repressor
MTKATELEPTSRRSMPAERRLQISELVEDRPTVRIDELADRFGVSRETIRRDLITLEGRGVIQRVHGGGIRPEIASSEPPFEERMVLRLEQKRAMARLAAELIGDVGTIFLDVGTSVAQVVDFLPSGFEGQIVTNSLLAANRLGERTGVDVVVCGGRMRHGDLALSGPEATEFLRGVFVEVAVLGSGGVHPAHGLTDFYPEEIALRRIVMDNAHTSLVMADSSKIGKIATYRVGSFDRLSGIVTDDEANSGYLSELRESGVTIHVAEAPSET